MLTRSKRERKSCGARRQFADAVQGTLGPKSKSVRSDAPCRTPIDEIVEINTEPRHIAFACSTPEHKQLNEAHQSLDHKSCAFQTIVVYIRPKEDGESMMTTEEWAVRIAEEVVPVETDFAPIWVNAFVAGAKERQELFAQTNAQAAGFLPGDFVPMLPMIFKGLAVAAPSILAILTSDITGKFLECLKNTIAIGETFVKKGKWFSSETTPAADEDICDRLNEIMLKLDKAMRPLRLKQNQADRINLIVMRLLLENPPDAKRFVETLAERK